MDIAFWTKNKEQILCPECAKVYPDIIYRKVMPKKDIPDYRSTFKLELYYNSSFFDNHKNKEPFKYCFCSEEEEIKELSSGIPRTEKCKCPQLHCPDKIDPEKQLLATTFSNNKFEILCDDTEFINKIINHDCYSLVQKLFAYNYLKEFNGDIVNISHKNNNNIESEYCGSITDVHIMIDQKDSIWREGNLKELKQRLVDIIDRLNFTVSFRYFNFDDKKINFNIYLTPQPFVPHNKGETGLTILFETTACIGETSTKNYS
jgi:hypothetical protein